MPESTTTGRRNRGLALGGAGLVLLFAPAVLLVVLPGLPAIYAIAPMAAGVVLLVAGALALPGSLAGLLQPKP